MMYRMKGLVLEEVKEPNEEGSAIHVKKYR